MWFQIKAWYGAIEAQIEHEQESSFTNYADLLTQYSDRCAMLLSEIDRALNFLDTMGTQYTSVSTKTNALHDACEQLVRDQTELVNFGESLSSRLSHFTELDKLTQTLKSPSLSVLNDQFAPLLGRLDKSIAYITAHPQYKDSATYLARFKQCQNRAMTLVKLHVVNTLKSATHNVSTQVQGKADEGPEASFTLFYGRFRMYVTRIRIR